VFVVSNAQDPNRFNDQVEELYNREYNFSPNKKLALFTGSSSVRMWNDVQERFPKYNVINNGFGGSHFSDLIYFYDKLIAKHNADYILIYEGDNDIASEKSAAEIMRGAKKLRKMIAEDFPDVTVVFIAPKPSIARWNLKKQYERVNKKLKKFTNRKKNTEFADVWNAMLDENGKVYDDIFIEDNLHMNKKGYDIWENVIGKFLIE
jgi:lysophospholipase L1-like esterase